MHFLYGESPVFSSAFPEVHKFPPRQIWAEIQWDAMRDTGWQLHAVSSVFCNLQIPAHRPQQSFSAASPLQKLKNSDFVQSGRFLPTGSATGKQSNDNLFSANIQLPVLPPIAPKGYSPLPCS